MNSIEKQKGALIGIGVLMLVLSVASMVFGVILIVAGASNLGGAIGIAKLVSGIILSLLSLVFIPYGIKCIWVGGALKATKGSLKQGNIAKDGGTVNMRKCDKCGTEIKDGESVCSNCGKPYQE